MEHQTDCPVYRIQHSKIVMGPGTFDGGDMGRGSAVPPCSCKQVSSDDNRGIQTPEKTGNVSD